MWTLTCVCNRWITPSSDTPTGRFRSTGDSSLPVHAAAPTATLDPTDIKAIRERVQAKIASLNGTNARVGDMLSKTVGGCTNPFSNTPTSPAGGRARVRRGVSRACEALHRIHRLPLRPIPDGGTFMHPHPVGCQLALLTLLP